MTRRDHSEWLVLAASQADRFWSKVEKTAGCWLWRASKTRWGYGKFAITAPRGERPKQLHMSAHRLAWELTNGPVPAGLVLMHSCDVRDCVNPAHLSPGTQAENRADCGRKGRNAVGARSGYHTKPEVFKRAAEARSRRFLFQDQQLTIAQIAARTGISAELISGRLKRGWSIDRAATETPANRGQAKRAVQP